MIAGPWALLAMSTAALAGLVENAALPQLHARLVASILRPQDVAFAAARGKVDRSRPNRTCARPLDPHGSPADPDNATLQVSKRRRHAARSKVEPLRLIIEQPLSALTPMGRKVPVSGLRGFAAGAGVPAERDIVASRWIENR